MIESVQVPNIRWRLANLWDQAWQHGIEFQKEARQQVRDELAKDEPGERTPHFSEEGE